MVKALAQFGFDGRLPGPDVSVDAPLAERLAVIAEIEVGMGSVIDQFAQSVAIPDGVTTTATSIVGVDGNDVTLYLSRPANAAASLPCIVHFHGGGMAMGSAADTGSVRWRENLAATGLLVVDIEFRNSAGKLGPHPYPAGLNDCGAAVRWVWANRRELGVSHLIVSGESGGGNLTFAVVHLAKRHGWLSEIAGAYAQCPAISNLYLQQPDHLPSMRENDDYFIGCQMAALLCSVYDPGKSNWQDATCFPGTASDDVLAGLPPHVISVNELDPLRDEGLLYYRRLVRAGSPAIGRVIAGTCHGGDLLCGGAMPEVFAASVRDVSGFAKSLG